MLFICNGDRMLMRECPICGKLHRQEEPCPYAKRRNEEYDWERRNYERSVFYHSSSWKAVRKIVKAAYHGLDIYEMNVNHHIVKGRIVHHIIPVSEAPEKAPVLTNFNPRSREGSDRPGSLPRLKTIRSLSLHLDRYKLSLI